METFLENSINLLRAFSKEKNIKIYIVGGFLRNSLKNSSSINKDIDFITDGDINEITKFLSDKLSGTIIDMDKKNRLSRIVFKNNFNFDFTNIYNNDLEKDLENRDCSINALAYSIHSPFPIERDYIIDNHNGINDFNNKLVRHINEKNYIKDPIRLLRNVRLMAEEDFNLHESTIGAIRKNAELLKEVSGEKICDEIFRIFQQEGTHYYLNFMDRTLNIANKIFPEVDDMKKIGECKYHVVDTWTHSIYTIKFIESVIYANGFFEGHIRKVYEKISSENIAGRRTRLAHFKLGALFHDIGKPSARFVDDTGRTRFRGHEDTGADIAKNFARKIRLSTKEENMLVKTVRLHMLPLVLYKKNDVGADALYDFFTKADEETLDILLIGLADIVATRKILNTKEEMGMFKVHIEYIANNYLTRYKPIENLNHIISGDDIMEHFNLEASKKIGEIKNILRKAIFKGKVAPKKKACIKYLEAEHLDFINQ